MGLDGILMSKVPDDEGFGIAILHVGQLNAPPLELYDLEEALVLNQRGLGGFRILRPNLRPDDRPGGPLLIIIS